MLFATNQLPDTERHECDDEKPCTGASDVKSNVSRAPIDALAEPGTISLV
jgi:hypothetical protein